MYFELQLSAPIFCRIVRNRLKALPLCLDREFVDTEGKLTGVKGAVVVVDRLEIGENTSIQPEHVEHIVNNLPSFVPGATQVHWEFSPTNYTSVTVPFLQVKQEVLIHLVKASELEANGANPTTPFRTLPLHVVFNVALNASNQTQGGGPVVMAYSFAHIDYGLLYHFLSNTQRQQIAQYVAGIQLPPTTLDLSALSSMLKRPVAAINAGIVCDPSASFIALRVDFDVYNSPIAVTSQFFTDPPEDLLDGKDWAMLIDRDVLVADARAKAKTALESDPKVRLESGPDVSWDPGGPALNISAAVELVDACPFFVDNINMDADVDIRVSISVNPPNTVRTHYHLEGEPSDVGEEIACALTGALLWPFIGPLFLKDEDLGTGIGAYLGGLAAGPVITFFGIIAAIETKKLSKDISDKLGTSCKKIDDENYECEEVVHAVMQLSPQFNSALEIEVVAGVARGLVFRGAVSNLRDLFMGSVEPIRVCRFKWQVVGRCTGNGRSNFRVGNQASISVFGTPPAAMCHARLIDDPQQEFVLTRDDNTITIVPQFKPAYVAAPYPCKVRVITNRGVRTITLAPPLAKTASESEELETARLSAHMGCYYWEKMFTPIEKIKWLPDPPFDRGRFAQFWQIVVRGLHQENAIRVLSHRGERIMTARPSRAGVAHITLLFTQDNAQPEIELELLGPAERGEEQREITLQQVLFEHRAALPVAAAPRAMRFEGGPRNRRLVVDDGEHEMAWSLSTPVAPSLMHSVGTGTHTMLMRHGDAGAELQQTPAVRGERHIVVHSGKRMGSTPGPNLLRALERIIDREGFPEVVGSPHVGGIPETLYVRTKAGARLFDVSSAEDPREMHTFDTPGWFECVALGGKILARYDDALGIIDLFTAALKKDCE
jgi:hypothetical protein